MNTDRKIRIAGSCVTGLYHKKNKIPCQDRILSKSHNGTTVIALADGAGSYKKPEKGAETVTSFVCDSLIKNFSDLYNKSNKDIAKELLNGMREKLSYKAKSLNISVKELSSTILFVGVKGGKYIAGHIGDGMIGCFEGNKALPLSHPDNDNEYTIFPMIKGALNRFRIYKNKLKKINGFILMSDGTYDSLYNKKTKQLTEANVTMFGWLQNQEYSDSMVESELKNTINDLFLENSLNGDDCSVNILAITDQKIAPKEIRKIDMKQVNDNTERIKKILTSVESINTKLETLEKKLSNKVVKNEFDDKLKSVANKNEVNILQSLIDESKSNIKDQDKKVKKLEKDLSSIKGEVSKFNDSLKSAGKNTLINDLNGLFKWKKNVQILLIILFLFCAGLIGLIIKLFIGIGG